jgi:hypothetical protein
MVGVYRRLVEATIGFIGGLGQSYCSPIEQGIHA